MKRPICLLLILFCFGLFFFSCKKRGPDSSRVVVAKLMDQFLYLDEMLIPEGYSEEDSADITKEYIEKWAVDILMYEKAKQNIADSTEITRLINEYRKNLIISEYKQKLIEERYAPRTEEEELLKYYDKHSKYMILKQNVIQGVLLVVPEGAPNMKKVDTWIKKADRESIERIEKYSLRNAVSYDYFVENWLQLKDVLKKTPFTEKEIIEAKEKQKLFEKSDGKHKYFLRITDYRAIGDVEPYELVRDNIIKILAIRQQADIITNIQNRMYKEAIEKGVIKIY